MPTDTAIVASPAEYALVEATINVNMGPSAVFEPRIRA